MTASPHILKKTWILLAILTCGFSVIWLLPDQQAMVPSRLAQELPAEVDGWQGELRQVGEAELKILAGDTSFARRHYVNPDPNSPGVEVSVVFSGKDINNSLHRPEVCLRAQGWNFVRERSILLKGVMPDGGDLPVREIVCVRPRIKHEGVDPPLNKFGQPVYDKRIQYYTFFGSEKIVSGHYQRTWEDIKARIVGGFDQRWAYATFSVPVTSIYEEQGVFAGVKSLDDDQAAQLMQNFIKTLLPEVLDHPAGK